MMVGGRTVRSPFTALEQLLETAGACELEKLKRVPDWSQRWANSQRC